MTQRLQDIDARSWGEGGGLCALTKENANTRSSETIT